MKEGKGIRGTKDEAFVAAVRSKDFYIVNLL